MVFQRLITDFEIQNPEIEVYKKEKFFKDLQEVLIKENIDQADICQIVRLFIAKLFFGRGERT